MGQDARPIAKVTSDIFLRYSINGTIPKSVDVSSYMDVGAILRGYANTGVINLYLDKLYRIHEEEFGGADGWSADFISLLSPECLNRLIDLFCDNLFQKCDLVDCSPTPDLCQRAIVATSIDSFLQCAIEKCSEENYLKDKNCSSIPANHRNASRALSSMYEYLMNSVETVYDPRFISTSKLLVAHIAGILETYNPLELPGHLLAMGRCKQWDIANLTHKYAERIPGGNISGNLTCDPSAEDIESTHTNSDFNSGGLLAGALVYLSILCIIFGRNFQSFNCKTSSIHVGSFFIGLFMAALVYIGSLHIYRDAQDNPDKKSREVQLLWRDFYLFVSFVCVYGSLLILSPSTITNEKMRLSFQRSSSNSKSMQKLSCFTVCFLPMRYSCCKKFKKICTGAAVSLQTIWTEWWLPSGQYFWVKLVILEIMEICIQLNSVMTSAATSHVNDVAISAILVSANLVLFPLMLLISGKLFPSSKYAKIATLMLVEVFFDKLYVLVAVLLRQSTLIQRDMAFSSQVSVHAALFVPALATALDISDALILMKHYKSASSLPTHDNKKVSFALTKITEVSKSQRAKRILRINSGMIMLTGIALATYTVTKLRKAHLKCEELLGEISFCATEKFYFAHGFFSDTTCSFENVSSFKCVGDFKLNSGVSRLPNAEAEYAKMGQLRLINVSGSSLQTVPKGWSLIPSKVGLTVDISESSRLSDIPFSLCKYSTKLERVFLRGTPVEISVNWTESLNISQIHGRSLNSACLKSFTHLRVLSLASNNLTQQSFGSDFHSMFPSLIALDLRYNNITNVATSPADQIFRPIVQRFVDSISRKYGNTSLLLEGNPLKAFSIISSSSRYAGEWINVLRSSRSMAKRLHVLASDWNDDHLSLLARSLDNSQVDTLGLSTNDFSGKGIAVLVQMLCKQNLHLRELALSNNGFGDEGAVALSSGFGCWKVSYLRVDGNLIKPFGAISIAQAISNVTTTSRLHIHNNDYGSSGRHALESAFCNSTFKYIKYDLTPGRTETRQNGSCV